MIPIKLPTRLLGMVIVLWAATGSLASWGQESEERWTQAPERVRCYGRILDLNRKPIVGAQVSLIAPHGLAYVVVGKITAQPAILSARTDDEGTFALEFDSLDEQFLGASPFLLMTQADGVAVEVTEMPMDRLLTDLPLEIVLRPTPATKLKVLDSQDQPVKGAKVRLARLNKVLLPFHLEPYAEVSSDPEGWVTLPRVDRHTLQAVYIDSIRAGTQMIPVETLDGNLVAKAKPLGQVKGQIALPENVAPNILNAKQALIYSLPNSGFALEGPKSFAWQVVTLDDSGAFFADRLACGTLAYQLVDSAELNLTVRMAELSKLTELTMDNSPLHWQLSLVPSRTYSLEFVGETGQPLPRLSFLGRDLGMFGAATKLTDEFGRCDFVFPQDERPSGQLFPSDAFGRVYLPPFGIDLERIKYNDDGSPQPIRLSPARSIVGQVFDEWGLPVAGAVVEYSFNEERFTREQKTLSDNSGRFEIRGLAKGAVLEIAASRGNATTTPGQRLQLTAGAREEVTLVLLAQPSAVPAGRVVDRAGNPLVAAKVTLQRIAVIEKEGFSAEQTRAESWSEYLPFRLTDNDGNFRFPTTPNYRDRIQISIEADGFMPFHAPFVSGDRLPLKDGNLDLGVFSLQPLPANVPVAITCVDAESNQAIPNAELIFIGAHAGKRSGVTGADGSVSLQLLNSPQVVVVRAAGYDLLLQSLTQIDESIQLTMQQATTSARPPLVWFNRSPEELRQASKQLYAQLERPMPGTTSPYREWLYYSALATADAETFVRTMSSPTEKIAQKDSILLFKLSSLASQIPRQAVEALGTSQLPAFQKMALFAQCAALVADEGLKDEWYGEAIIGLDGLSGSMHLVATGHVARYLILDGRIEAARAIVQRAWEQAKDYRELLQQEKQKQDIGVARIFGPVLAIVDPDSALKLIPLLSLQQEADRLRDQALGALSLCDWEQFERLCRERGLTYRGGAADWILASELGGTLHPRNAQWAARVVEIIEDSNMRLALSLLAAQSLAPSDANVERNRLLALAVQSWNNAPISLWYHWDDPAKFATEQLATFYTLQPHELDSLIFACFQKAPTTFDSMNLLGVLGDVARLLAMRDAKVARALLEPVFEDTQWQFDHLGGARFDRNIVLNSTVWIDPNWAIELAQQLSDRYSPDDPIRKMQIHCSLISEIDAMLLRLSRRVDNGQ